MQIKNTELFHIHTHRCGHAEQIPDEEFIKKAIQCGYTGIWFTDHAPFPGDPFGNRMLIDDFPSYIEELIELKETYRKQNFSVHIGLEIEYLPTFDKTGWYQELRRNRNIECLLLGQHMAEIAPNVYSFEKTQEEKDLFQHIWEGNNILSGLRTGYFDVLAHPDRVLKRRKEYGIHEKEIMENIMEEAKNNDVLLEFNARSVRLELSDAQKSFLNNANTNKWIIGADAHFLSEISFDL